MIAVELSFGQLKDAVRKLSITSKSNMNSDMLDMGIIPKKMSHQGYCNPFPIHDN